MWVLGCIIYVALAVICYAELYSHRLDLQGRFKTPYDIKRSRWQNFWDHVPEVGHLWISDLTRGWSPKWLNWLCRQIIAVPFAPISWIGIKILEIIAKTLRPYVERRNAKYKPPKRQTW